MKWKSKFRQFILERGYDYYKRNRVQGLCYVKGVFKARVLGNIPYDVQVLVDGDKLISMKCSCPYAQDGQRCKHMAAVLYAIEEKGEALKDTQIKMSVVDRPVKPFALSTDEYRYFDMGRIADKLEFTESMLVQARRLLEQRSVVLDRVVMRYLPSNQGGGLQGVALGKTTDRKYPSEVRVTFNRDSIVEASCGAPGCGGYYISNYSGGYYSGNWRKICPHLLALMLLLDKYLKTHNPGDSTDSDAAVMFMGFRGQQFIETVDQGEQLYDFVIEPMLERGQDELFATFRAGVGRLYVVKNLTQLVYACDGRDGINFGSKTEIDLAKHRLNEESEAVYEFVRGVVREEDSRAERLNRMYGYHAVDGEMKNKIPLYGDRLDRFFALLEGKTVAFTDKSTGKAVKGNRLFTDGNLDFSLKIVKDMDAENIVHGIRVSGKLPEMIEGASKHYFFTEKEFCRLDEGMLGQIKPLLNISQDGNVAFRVGRKYLSEFYHQVLPVLKRHASIEEVEPEVIAEYIPPEPSFVFYLDAENGMITCRPEVCYGDERVLLLDNLRQDHVWQDFRNYIQENDVLIRLRDFFGEWDQEKDELCCEATDERVLSLLDGGIDRLLAMGEVHTTERFRNMNTRKKVTIKVGVSIDSTIMDLSVSSEEIDQEELLSILMNYRKKKKYYRLKNGNFAEVNEADIETLNQMMEAMHLSPKEFVKGNMKVPLYRALYLNKMLEQSEELYLNRDRNFKHLVKEFKTVEDSEFEVPSSLAPIMRNYQVKGFRWLKTLEHYGFGGILADDMGLGKTLQMISVLLSAKENGKKEISALIVCPASLVYNWKEEFSRFAPELKVVVVAGTQQERSWLISEWQSSDVLVTSYDLLKRDIAEYEGIRFDYQVIDEAQYIKNHGTAAAKAVKVIKSSHRYALTGTPIENRLSELWSIFDYLMPGFLYGYETFRKELETPIVKNQQEEASERLKKMVSPFILRRLKGDVLRDLPEKMEEIRYTRLENEQQMLYDGQVVHMQRMIAEQNAENFQKNKLQILAELTKIRQICCDPSLLFEQYQGESAKRTACMELIRSAIEGEHKMLVFSQFTSMLELLEADLRRENIEYYKITGSTPKEKRLEMVSAFNQDSTPVFLISLKAGGTGLNLTGADVVIHYDPWWNQAAQNQATDRAHRIGQKNAVSVYKLIAKDTIEEKIVKMQADKQNLADSILSGESGGLGQMSREELLELIG